MDGLLTRAVFQSFLNKPRKPQRVPYRDAFLEGWHCIEIEKRMSTEMLLDWLEAHGAKQYGLAGLQNSKQQCFAIKDKDIAMLFKLTWV